TAATTLLDSDLPLRLASRTDFALHVQAIAGPDGAGVWIPDSLVELTGLRVGDRLRLVNGPAAAPPPRVAAVYHDLRGAPDQRYWCSVTYLYRGLPGEGNFVPVPPLVLMDSGPMLNTLSALNMTGTHIIEYPIADNRLTQPDAARMGAAVARMRTGLYEADPPVFRSDYTANTQFQSNIGAFADRAD